MIKEAIENNDVVTSGSIVQGIIYKFLIIIILLLLHVSVTLNSCPVDRFSKFL